MATVEIWERGGAREPVPTHALMDSLTKGFEPSFVRVALDLLADDDWLDARARWGRKARLK